MNDDGKRSGLNGEPLRLLCGTGIRFLMSKKCHVNLRTDFAWGRDSFTWAVGVGEAV